jgi:transcriptional regulator with XRE-family HTH domain
MTTNRVRPFDSQAFFAALNAAREARDLTWKELASQAGVSASTLTRVGQGKRPDVDSFATLVTWAGLKPQDFIGTSSRDSEPLAEISVLLRRDPHLNDEAAAALDELLKATYKRLRNA